MGQLAQAIAALDKKAALSAVDSALQANTDPLDLVDDARQGLEVVGAKFERGEFFLMELMRAAQIFQSVAAVLNPRIVQAHGGITTNGTVVLGTVAGDIHDLGKNIVRILLECRGVKVIDLGVDVPTVKFVEAVKDYQPQVLGMSALLTASVSEMKKNIAALQQAGLREQVKVVVGGGIVGEIDSAVLKADLATIDANQGVNQIAQWVA
jgi:methanogenic corrinoid protein MtbC1